MRQAASHGRGIAHRKCDTPCLIATGSTCVFPPETGYGALHCREITNRNAIRRIGYQVVPHVCHRRWDTAYRGEAAVPPDIRYAVLCLSYRSGFSVSIVDTTSRTCDTPYWTVGGSPWLFLTEMRYAASNLLDRWGFNPWSINLLPPTEKPYVARYCSYRKDSPYRCTILPTEMRSYGVSEFPYFKRFSMSVCSIRLVLSRRMLRSIPPDALSTDDLVPTRCPSRVEGWYYRPKLFTPFRS